MRRSARLLLVGGVASAVLALGKLHAAYVAEPAYDFTGSSRFGWSILLIASHAGAAYALGLPDIVRSRRQAVATALMSSVTATVLVSVAQIAFGAAYLPRLVVGSTALLVVGWYSVCVELASAGRTFDAERDRIVVVGSWADASDLRRELEIGAERHARIVDVLTVREARPSGDGRRPLVEAVQMGEATVVVLDREAQAEESIVDQVAQLHESGTRVRTLSLFYEQWLGKLPVAELERVSLMFDIGELHRARFGRMKRVADVVVAGALVPVLAFVAVTVVVLNRFGNRGPLLFRQERIGRHGRPFTIVKFRTMRSQAAEAAATPERADRRRAHHPGRRCATAHPPGRAAPGGQRAARRPFDRRAPTRTDGLRGGAGWEAALLPHAPPRAAGGDRLGPGQVRLCASESDALEKLQYEFYYLRHQSLPMDARILARTVRQVVGRRGR